MAEEAAALNAGFISRMARGRPRVTVKLAASLDGRTAMASGESRWITGPAARDDVQRLRGESCAIVTGIGTVLADDPRLDVRLPAELTLGRQPLRVVLDSRLRISQQARVLAPPGRALVFTAQAASPAAEPLRAAGAEVEGLPPADTGWTWRRCWPRWRRANATRSWSRRARGWPAHSPRRAWPTASWSISRRA
jgi:diaminohydroxyphosphoribosylaminopyrimidine deaminase / 5-amino-6-(5-phosphoribosylamino)uracil reductase